jgi:hypothetical protein
LPPPGGFGEARLPLITLSEFPGPLLIPGVQYADISVFIALGSNDHGGGDHEFQLTLEDLAWIGSLGTTISFVLTYVREEPRDIMGQHEK